MAGYQHKLETLCRTKNIQQFFQ